MNYDMTLLNYFWHASLVVKCVMLILVVSSIYSWSFILQRYFFLRDAASAAESFTKRFATSEDLNHMYAETRHKENLTGAEAIFCAGVKEFSRMQQRHAGFDLSMQNTQRAMHVASMREQDKLETHLPFLAIVGSTSPYIGLFGTVWGIMQAFRALANVSQVSIAMVAPGIAEALIATALGLFAAIPAVIAYNRFVTDIGRLMSRYDGFQEELINALIRKSRRHDHDEEKMQPRDHEAKPANYQASADTLAHGESKATRNNANLLDLIENRVD